MVIIEWRQLSLIVASRPDGCPVLPRRWNRFSMTPPFEPTPSFGARRPVGSLRGQTRRWQTLRLRLRNGALAPSPFRLLRRRRPWSRRSVRPAGLRVQLRPMCCPRMTPVGLPERQVPRRFLFWMERHGPNRCSTMRFPRQQPRPGTLPIASAIGAGWVAYWDRRAQAMRPSRVDTTRRRLRPPACLLRTRPKRPSSMRPPSAAATSAG